jgi:lysine 6-dehydrogenase
MPRAIVLGAGMVGSVMAADLAVDGEFEVTIADINEKSLAAARARCGRLAAVKADLGDPSQVKSLVEPFDVVLGALASRIGFQTLRAVIESGRNYCDISFMPENALELDGLAKEHGVTAVVDCGVAPGMSNMLAGCAAARLDPCERIDIYVGGLPRVRTWPFQYKAAFSPADVIEEYTRPSRTVEHGQVVEREALSEPELLHLSTVGTVEAFNTDGLRSLAHTLGVPFMKEKTLRYPGHLELMRVLRAMGLFSKEPIDVAGVKVRPIDVTAALMFPMWSYQDGEEDLTVMRVVAEGKAADRPARLQWDLLDFYDRASKTTSMARTTAFPCAIVARMLASGRLRKPGVIPPERIGADQAMLDHALKEHERRGVVYRATQLPR